jgi:hypothetical protein
MMRLEKVTEIAVPVGVIAGLNSVDQSQRRQSSIRR